MALGLIFTWFAFSAPFRAEVAGKLLILWIELKSLIKVEATRIIKEKETKEIRYYISDEQGLSASCFNALVRGHWGIEKQLHWHLDVTFKEDSCRARKRNAPENLSALRKFALQIPHEQHDRLSLKK
jgi:predicted transposase YbfD/YdcC